MELLNLETFKQKVFNFETNKEWLIPYAAFSYLRDLNGTPEFGKWKEFSKYDLKEIEDEVIAKDYSFRGGPPCLRK